VPEVEDPVAVVLEDVGVLWLVEEWPGSALLR